MSPNLLKETDAAKLLGIAVATLRTWRCTSRVNLPFVRLGRAVRYRPEDLESFIRAETVGGTERGRPMNPHALPEAGTSGRVT